MNLLISVTLFSTSILVTHSFVHSTNIFEHCARGDTIPGAENLLKKKRNTFPSIIRVTF